MTGITVYDMDAKLIERISEENDVSVAEVVEALLQAVEALLQAVEDEGVTISIWL